MADLSEKNSDDNHNFRLMGVHPPVTPDMTGVENTGIEMVQSEVTDHHGGLHIGYTPVKRLHVDHDKM